MVGPVVQTCQVCPKLPPRHSCQNLCSDFGGENTEAAPYPPWSGLRRFGSVSAAADWQWLNATFIVELFTFRFFGGYPEDVTLRRIGVATVRLPTPARVARTSRALHPIGPNGFGPCPAGGLGSPWASAPALNPTAPPICTAEHVPLAPIRERHLDAMR